jgi:hypothetical protein
MPSIPFDSSPLYFSKPGDEQNNISPSLRVREQRQIRVTARMVSESEQWQRKACGGETEIKSKSDFTKVGPVHEWGEFFIEYQIHFKYNYKIHFLYVANKKQQAERCVIDYEFEEL